MKETNKYSKVDTLPFFDGILTKEKLKEIRNDYPGQPSDLKYRKEFIKGRGASRKDKTWNKHIHTCCNSKVPWRHKAMCPLLTKEI